MKKNNKTKQAALLLSAALIASLSTAVYAGETILNGGTTAGAMINDAGGATYTTNGTNAQMNINGKGNVIKWDYLNVDKGKSLDFNFSQKGQVALNKVTGTSMSKFAGSLSTSGENGNLIISNPNGMIFTNGVTVNVNGSATFTTHDVTWDGELNGKITTSENGTKKGVTVGGGNTTLAIPVFRVNNDLNIIAPGIDVTGADLFAGGTVRMSSADGVNFVATPTNTNFKETAASSVHPVNVQYARANAAGDVYYGGGDYSSIKVKNTTVKATDSAMTADGRLYLYANNNINTDNVETGKLYAKTNGIANINNTKVYGTEHSYIGGKASTVIANSTIKDSDVETDSATFSYSNLNKVNTFAKSASSTTATFEDSFLAISGDAFIHNSMLNNSTLNTDGTTVISNSNVDNSGIHARNLSARSVEFNDSNVRADYNMDIMELSNVNRTRLDSEYNINVRDSKIKDNSTLTTSFGNIYLNNSEMKNSTASTIQGIAVNYSDVSDSKMQTFLDRVDIIGSTVTNSEINSGLASLGLGTSNDINVISSTVAKTKLNATGNINTDNATVSNSELTAGGGSNIFNTKMNNSMANIAGDTNVSYFSELDGVQLNSDGKIIVASSTLKNGTYITGKEDILLQNATVDSSSARSDKNIDVTYFSNLDRATVYGSGNVNISDSTLKNSTRVWARDDLNVAASNVSNSGLTADRDVNISYYTNLDQFTNVSGYNKVNISDSTMSEHGYIYAGQEVNIAASNIKDSMMYSGGNVNVVYNSNLDSSFAFANNNVYTENSNFSNADITGLNDVSFNGGQISTTTASAGNDMKINNSMISDSQLDAGKDILASNATSIVNTTANAGKDIVLNNGVDVNNSEFKAVRDFTADTVGFTDTNVYANRTVTLKTVDVDDRNLTIHDAENINLENVTSENAIFSAKNNITTKDSTLKASNLESKNMDFKDSSLISVRADASEKITADNIQIKNGGSLIGLQGVDITNSQIAGGYISSDKDVNISGTKMQNSYLDAGENITVENADMYDMDMGAGNDISITDSKGEDELNAYAGNDIKILGSSLDNVTLSANGKIQIANSRKEGTYDFSMDPKTTTNGAVDNGHIFEEGTPSVINNLNVQKAGSLDIANTHVKGNFNVNASNVGETSIVYSTIEKGNRNTILSFAGNVLESFIGLWKTPNNIPNGDEADLHGATEYYKLGEDIDTIFRKRFMPKSFAATEDEVKAAKEATVNNTLQAEDGTIKIQQEFRVH